MIVLTCWVQTAQQALVAAAALKAAMLDLELSMLQSEHTDVLSYVALSFISSHSPRLIVCPLSYFNSLPEQTLVASAATLSDMHTQMEHATGCLAAAQAKEKDGAVIQLYRLYVEALRQLIADKTAQQEHARVRVGAAMDMKGAVEGRLAGGGLTPLDLSILMV